MEFKATGLDRMIREIGRLADSPSPETVAMMDSTLAAQFADTQARVHVLSSHLKQSGWSHASHHDDEWEGRIEYGSPGSGLDYAIYHLHENNYFAGVRELEAGYEAAIDHHLSGGSW